MSNKKEASVESGTTAKDFFLYLAFAVTLIWLITSFFMGSFSIIDELFPDVLDKGYGYGLSSALWTSIASLVIVTPFFLIISWLINKDLKINPEKKDIWIRKWMLYALLFIAFVVILVDLVMLSNNFFRGELTARFIAKFSVVIIVAPAVFAYFLNDLRRDFREQSKAPLLSGIVTVLSIFLLITVGFVVGGSPSEQRDRRLDAERVSAIQQIGWEIDAYVSENRKLPESLSEIPYISMNWQDPVTGEDYTYVVTGEDSFELCAVFATSDMPGEVNPVKPVNKRLYQGSLLMVPSSFEHEEGSVCFQYGVRELSDLENSSS